MVATGVVFVFLMSLPFLPFAGAVELFSVRSGSMEPALPTGSLIFVRPASEYVVGDIITVQTTDEKTVTHRIVEVLSTDMGVAFRTKGDNNEEPDPVDVMPVDVIGKTLVTIPFIGYPVAYAQTQNGFLILIVLPAILIIMSEIFSISREVRRLWRKRSMMRPADSAIAQNVTFAPMRTSLHSSSSPRMIVPPPLRKRIV